MDMLFRKMEISDLIVRLPNRWRLGETYSVEEMYGMIWFLAGTYLGREKQMVDDARKYYREGLKVAKSVNK